VTALPDTEPVLGDELLRLCRWMSEYYVVPLGVAIRTVLPAALGSQDDPEPSRRTRRVAKIGVELAALVQRDETFARARKQRAVYELLESLGGRAPVEHLTGQLKVSPSVLRSMTQRGLVTLENEVIARDPFAWRATPAAAAHTPSSAQQAAIDALST